MAEKDDYSRRKAQLEIEKQIAEAIKNSTASLSDFTEAQKKISKNYKLIREIQSEINLLIAEAERLESEGTKESKEQAAILRAELNTLQQQQKVLVSVNKELSKGKNLAKAVGNQLLEWGKSLKSQFVPGLGEAFNKFLDLNDLAIQTSVNIGMSGEGMKLMVKSIESSQSAWGDLGFDLESSARFQQSIADETGRQVVLSEQVQQTAALTARALNMQADELGGLLGQMDQFGLGSEMAMKSIMSMRVESEKMGVNSGKVIKKFQQNLELMNRLNFKDGVKGMQKMAILSEKYKIEMNSIASAAEAAFNPEGAIEMAAKLQLLGGNLAGLGDPFQLMYKARNNPEKFMEDITMAAKQSATFDPKSGEFKVSAMEMDRLRVASEATNISMDELVKTAKQGAKMDYFGSMLKGVNLTPEQKDMLSGMMEITEGGQILINGNDFSKMTKQDLDKLTTRETELIKLTDEAQSTQKELAGIKNAIMIAFVELFKGIDWKKYFGVVKDVLISVRDFAKTLKEYFSPGGFLTTVLGLYFGSKVLWPMIQGALFGRSAAAAFNAGTMGGGLIDEVTSKGGGPGDITKGIDNKKIDAISNSTKGLGSVSSISTPQILALGTALLMVSGAIWIVSQAMIKMHEAGVGFTEILGVIGAGIAIMIPLVTALGVVGTVTSGPILALGVAFLLIGGGIALASYGMSLLVDSFTTMFTVIGNNGSSLILAGVGFMAMAAGIGALTISLTALSFASLLALPGLLMLGSVTSMLTSTATALNAVGGGDGITKTIKAINSVDESKLEALKDLSMWMALVGASPTIKFDESLTIDGSIQLTGQAGGKSNTDWVSDPIFVSKLKELITSSAVADKRGGK